ncbi:hypothetical protein [Tsuneonella sp. HG222]
MMKRLFTCIALGLTACGSSSTDDVEQRSEDDTKKLWVTEQYAERHTCASRECGVVGRLFFREGVTPEEEKDGWVRVSRYYDASCADGRSEYVDEGSAECAETNGITNGQFAEWIERTKLSEVRPADPADTASVDEAMIAQSDDFNLHREAFLTAANQLIADGTCTAAEFEEMGGWVKSSNHRNEPIYFTYCGGMTTSNRVYVDVSDGRIFR